MRQSIRWLFASVLFGALLPMIAWGYGLAPYPGDRDHRPYTGSTRVHHSSGSVRVKTGITEEGYYVRIQLDGLRPEDIHVYLQRNCLVLQTRKAGQHSSNNPNTRRLSQWQIHFRRQLRLPYDADVTRMTTSTRNGSMEIYLPAILPLERNNGSD
jgi:HSP20 family molecular chaperone IbpA